MRAILTSWLAVCLFLGAIPQAARVRLICRISGQVMPMNAEQACCNVVTGHDGQLVLQAPGCCELQIAPAEPDVPTTTLSAVTPLVAALPIYPALVPHVAFTASPTVLSFVRPHAPRGPPRQPSSPRAPPVFS